MIDVQRVLAYISFSLLEFGTNQGIIKTITRVDLKREACNRNAFLYLIGPLIELSCWWFAQLLFYDIPVDILRALG